MQKNDFVYLEDDGFNLYKVLEVTNFAMFQSQKTLEIINVRGEETQKYSVVITDFTRIFNKARRCGHSIKEKAWREFLETRVEIELPARNWNLFDVKEQALHYEYLKMLDGDYFRKKDLDVVLNDVFCMLSYDASIFVEKVFYNPVLRAHLYSLQQIKEIWQNKYFLNKIYKHRFFKTMFAIPKDALQHLEGLNLQEQF